MFTKFIAFAASLLLIPSAALGAVLEPRADTPLFHLVANTAASAFHLENVKTTGTLASTGTPAKFYLEGGAIRAQNSGPSGPLLGLINSPQGPNGCNAGGPFLLLPGFGSNKCARTSPFGLSSFILNAQLGSKLTFDSPSNLNFYVDGNGALEVSGSAPAGKTLVELWTVPVGGWP